MLTLEASLHQIDDPRRDILLRIYEDHADLFHANPGSTHIHQCWEGGLADHLAEMMRLSVLEYDMLNRYLGPRNESLPFTLASAQIVIFCHDAEKLYVYAPEDERCLPIVNSVKADLAEPIYRHALITKDELDVSGKLFKEALKAYALDHWLIGYGLRLTPNEMNAVTYTHGEGADYDNTRRVMNELAAFVGNIDRTSARILYNSGKDLG